MNTRMGIYLCLATVATWASVAFGSGIVLQNSPLFWEAMGLQVIILIMFIALTWPREDKHWWSAKLILWLLLPIIFVLTLRVQIEFFFIYTIIWIACSPSFISARLSWLMLLLISVFWYCLRAFVLDQSHPLMQTLLVSTFHMFALLSAMAALASEQANEKTKTLNRQLLATQHLLSEASVENERTRIARDLHDLLGHHLTALTINLQVLSHQTEGEAKAKTEQCYGLSKLLLGDVREAVSTLRDMPLVNLRELLEITISDIPRLQIALAMSDEVKVDDVNTAEVLLRCVQEAITNSLRHSKARNAKISVASTNANIELVYQDDGGGCEGFTEGNGLKGMQERVDKIKGTLLIEPSPNMRLSIKVPTPA